MRAWYGRGRYWFVVAGSAGASAAWGWYGYAERWEPLGHEFIDWHETDFANAIDERLIPAELFQALAQTLDDMANARVTKAHDFPSQRSGTAPTTRTWH